MKEKGHLEGKSNKIKRFFSKFWQIVWKDDSFKGWLISLVFIFVIIKFIFFPILNLATGTELPLAIVESCSMYHTGNVFSSFDNWWDRRYSIYEEFDINKSEFEDFNFKRGFSKGDIIFIVNIKPEKIEIGDIIIFNAGYKNPIIHRVMNIKQVNGDYIFSTMGDSNGRQEPSFDINIKSEQIIGKAVFRIVPSVGWVKLIFYEHLKEDKGFCGNQQLKAP